MDFRHSGFEKGASGRPLFQIESWGNFTLLFTTFLDPACKSGVFLREITKRLIKGLEKKIPDLNKRLEHIYTRQVFGIAITELTSLLSRRSLYCSKYPSGEFSIYRFGDNQPQGNIVFQKVKHSWVDGKCKYCGATQSIYERSSELESHAYQFIHASDLEGIFKMKFDVIIGNPPYQLSDGGNGASAKPIYQHFISQAIKLKPRYVSMITPSRWFTGGKGLDKFREDMLTSHHITHLVDYQNAKDCFPGVSIGGGVCYFLWERDKESDCRVTNIISGREIITVRKLDQYPVFVRYNDAISIIDKVHKKKEDSFKELLSSRNPFGISTNFRGGEKKTKGTVTLYTSQGKSYIPRKDVSQGKEWIDKYKIMISRASAEHAGEPDKSGMYSVISTMKILSPGEICSDTYIIAYPCDNLTEVENAYKYLKTKFARFLVMQAISSINLSRGAYFFVPKQDFTKEYSDTELYQKYRLSEAEIGFIESMIKPKE